MQKQAVQAGDFKEVVQDALIAKETFLSLLHLFERIFSRGREISPQKGLVNDIQVIATTGNISSKRLIFIAMARFLSMIFIPYH